MPNKDKERTPTLITSLLQTIVPMVQLAFEAAPRLFSLTFVLLLTKSVIPIIVAWLTKLLFDELGTLDTVSAENSDYIISIVIWLGMFIILSYTFKSIETYLLDELGRKAELHLSAKLYGKLASLPGLKHFESPQFHNAIQIASQNVNWLPSEILRKTISLISSFITITVFLLVILRMSVLISLVLFIVAIPSFWMQLHFRKKRFETDTGAISIQRMANYMASILSSSHAAKEIRLFITGNFFLKKYVNFMTELNNRYRLLSKREMIGLGFINFLNAITMVGINIFAVIEFLNRKISLGDITFYLNATNSIRENLNNISWIIATLGERSLYFRYYLDIIQIDPAIVCAEDSLEAPPLQNVIQFKNVSFRYSKTGPFVLENVSFEIKKGECTALIGKNGSGKSTIVKLLARFYDPTDGQILWDETDIRYFKPESLRKRLGIVFQDFFRYELTARENIGIGDYKSIDNLRKIRQAAIRADIDHFLQQLPEQYETYLSLWLSQENNKENGIDLSGGQWQKIALARINMKESDLIILDEPTAALDADAEASLVEQLHSLTTNQTCFIISHRFSTLYIAAEIIVLSDGQVAARGTHDHLINHNDLYRTLYLAQTEIKHKVHHTGSS